jgi:hypothetical protein
MFPINTVDDPGAHGAGVSGIQGIGVKTPAAAVVAAATSGLEGALHIPKVGMFTVGALSMMVAARVCAMTLFCGRTIRELGAAPKLHCSVAPMHTSKGIANSLLSGGS